MANSVVSLNRRISLTGIFWPVCILCCLGILVIAKPNLTPLIVETLAEAYLAVSVFVAGTLLLFNSLEAVFKINVAETLSRYRLWQTPVAAFLGALPGCGGAIMVTTYFIQGRISFGAVVAALTSTMGDAAFLLLAQEPSTGMTVFAMGIGVGIISGYIVDLIHNKSFMRPPPQAKATREELYGYLAIPPYLLRIFIALFIPGLIIGILQAFQVDTKNFIADDFVLYFGFVGAFFSTVVWLLSKHKVANSLQLTKLDNSHLDNTCKVRVNASNYSGLSIVVVKAFRDTNFITTWVVLGFLVYELGLVLLGIDMAKITQAWMPLLPLLGVVVGFLPGCGPQILITTMYLSGALPLSAQLGNAISNDGDALFPALALAPKAAIVATLYSAVPAIIIAYAYYGFFE